MAVDVGAQILQIRFIVVRNRFGGKTAQQIGKSALFKAMRDSQPLGDFTFHAFRKLPVGRPYFLAVGLRNVEEVFDRQLCIFVFADGDPVFP